MTVKIISLGVILLSLVGLAEIPSELQRAYRFGAESKVVYQVVDNDGYSVPNADVEIWYRSYGRPQDNAHWKTTTDTNGLFVAQHRTNERLYVVVKKIGYYFAKDEISYFDSCQNQVEDGKWQPYGSKRQLVLNKIINPISMCRHDEMDSRKIPVYGHWLGFDLEKFDFLPPNGAGVKEDVLLRFSLIRGSDYFAAVEMSFTNQLYAGVRPKMINNSSELKFQYRADTNETYVSTCYYSYERKSGQLPILKTLNEGSYLIFRTRTKCDKEGRLKSAQYGIIEGPLEFVGPGGFSVRSCLFNPVKNDQNLEWNKRKKFGFDSVDVD